jgi:hypothetical protein
MKSSKSCACLQRPDIYLLAAIYVVCYAITSAHTNGITASIIYMENSSGLRVSRQSQIDAVELNSTKQRLDEIAGSFTKGDAFMGAVLVATGSDILHDRGYGKAVDGREKTKHCSQRVYQGCRIFLPNYRQTGSNGDR